MLNLNSKKVKNNLPELFTQIQNNFESANNFKSMQAEDYKRAWLYYDGKMPLPVVENGSSYIEPVLREAVDRILPTQLNIFTATDSHAVQYRPMGMIIGKNGAPVNTTMVADAVNHKINEIFLRDNNGYEVLSNAFTEALVSGGTYTKQYVKEDYVEDCVEFEDWVPGTVLIPLMKEYPDTDFSVLEKKVVTEEIPNPIAQDPLAEMVTDAPATQEISIPYVRGKLDLLRIERKINVDYVPFNEVFLDSSIIELKDARYLCHRQIFTVGQLIEMGFDEEKVKSADSYEQGSDYLSKKNLLVDGTFVDDNADGILYSIDPLERKVYLYEHFLYSSLLEGKTKLYRVFATNFEILEIHDADYIPFQFGKALEVPGSMLGNSLYKICGPYQDSLSHLQRMSLDNMTKVTHGRYYAVENMFDARSLMKWKPNGIINVKQQGAITPEVTHQLPAYFENIAARMSDSRDRSIGLQISNQMDAGSLNNVAAATVSMLLGNQEIKDKRIAGTLARTLVRPLFEVMYKLLREEAIDLNLKDGSVFNTADLPKLCNFTVDVTTANDEANLTGILMNVMQLDAQLAAVPGRVIDSRAVLVQIMKNGGLTDEQAMSYLPPPPQPTPEEQQKAMLMQQLEVEAAVENVELLKADKQHKAAEIARIEIEISEKIKNGAADRKREEEKSAREFIVTETKVKELEMELDIYRKQGEYQNVVVGQ